MSQVTMQEDFDVAERILSSLCRRTKTVRIRQCERLAVFESVMAPKIPMRRYISHVMRGLRASRATLITAWVYLDRYVKQRRDEGYERDVVNPHTQHRLFFACLMLAHKWLEDEAFCVESYAACGLVKKWEIERMLRELLRALQWRIWVLPEEFENYDDLLSMRFYYGLASAA